MDGADRADARATPRPIVPPILRPRFLLAALALVGCLPASAHASELFAAPGGGGPDCANAAAPCSVAAALIAARGSPGADVVNLAAGIYAETITATDPADTDVTLRGAGIRQTVLTAAPADGPMIQLGAGGAGTMAIEDLTIDGPASGINSSALRSRLGRLTLTRVWVLHTHGPLGKMVPAIDADDASSELVLDAVNVLADTEPYDTSIGAITAGGPLTVRDSRIVHTSTGDSAAIFARGDVTIQRSTITRGDANAGYALRFSNTSTAHTIAIDSSLLTGGKTGARFDIGALATQVALRGVTVSPFWLSNGYGVDLNATEGGSLARASITSSLLLTRSVRVSGGAQASCTFTNLPPTGSDGDPDCSTAPDNPAGNTTLRTDELRLDKDLTPRTDSPVIDAGDPAGVAAGESAGDRLGRPRAGASADTCDAGPGRRDKGAFERYRPRPKVTISGPDRPTANSTVAFEATSDAIDPTYSWSFGDETVGRGNTTTSHAFAAGASSVILEVTDRASGCSASAIKSITATSAAAPAGAVRDRTAPRVTRARLVRSRSARRTKSKLRFTLSENATVTLTIGRLKGKRLVASRRITIRGKRGVNRVALSYRKLKLRRWRFAVRISARDAAGNAAKPVALKLTVRRRSTVRRA